MSIAKWIIGYLQATCLLVKNTNKGSSAFYYITELKPLLTIVLYLLYPFVKLETFSIEIHPLIPTEFELAVSLISLTY